MATGRQKPGVLAATFHNGTLSIDNAAEHDPDTMSAQERDRWREQMQAVGYLDATVGPSPLGGYSCRYATMGQITGATRFTVTVAYEQRHLHGKDAQELRDLLTTLIEGKREAILARKRAGRRKRGEARGMTQADAVAIGQAVRDAESR